MRSSGTVRRRLLAFTPSHFHETDSLSAETFMNESSGFHVRMLYEELGRAGFSWLDEFEPPLAENDK